MKGKFKQYFDAGYRQIHLTEMPKDTGKAIDSLQKCENIHRTEVQHYASNFVCGHCSYGTICWSKHVTGREITDKNTTELAKLMKPEIKRWVQKGPQEDQKWDPRKQTKKRQEKADLPPV